jgi:hypothetical protein
VLPQRLLAHLEVVHRVHYLVVYYGELLQRGVSGFLVDVQEQTVNGLGQPDAHVAPVLSLRRALVHRKPLDARRGRDQGVEIVDYRDGNLPRAVVVDLFVVGRFFEIPG